MEPTIEDGYVRQAKTMRDATLAETIMKLKSEISKLNTQDHVLIGSKKRRLVEITYFAKKLDYFMKFKKICEPAIHEEQLLPALFSQKFRIESEIISKYQDMIKKEIAEKTMNLQKEIDVLQSRQKLRTELHKHGKCFHLDVDDTCFKSLLCPVCGARIRYAN